MRILGIDPGFDRLGLAIVEGNASKPTLVWSTCVEPETKKLEERLAAVYDAVRDALTTYEPDAASLETLYFSSSKTTAITVGEARGAVLAALGPAGLPLLEFTPQQVKLAVTGHGGADKKAVALMLPKLIALPIKKRRDDELDAIAIAITGLSTYRGR